MKTLINLITLIFLCFCAYQCTEVYHKNNKQVNVRDQDKVPVAKVKNHLAPPLLPRYQLKVRKKSMSERVDLFLTGGSTYPHAKKIIEVCVLDDEFIRNVRADIDRRHAGRLNLGVICDIFDLIHDNRTYLEDPLGQEYFSTPQEYWTNFIGDCDDESIASSTATWAVGAFSRMVLAYGTLGGHAYTEIYCGQNAIEVRKFEYYIRQRYRLGVNQEVSFYQDDRNMYWLSLDANNDYPGGKLFDGGRRHYFYPSIQYWCDL